QIFLRRLIVGVGEFAEPVLELEVAEVLVNCCLPLVEVQKRRDGLGFRKILGPHSQDERDNDDRNEAGEGDNHSRFARSFSIWSLYFASAGSSISTGPSSVIGLGL